MNPMITLLPKILKWTEILAIVVASAGLLLKISSYPGFAELIMIGLMTLASTYFLSAYVFVEGLDNKEKKGLTDLLPTILRKIIYIGLSVYWIAFLFAILHLAGANEMLIIGVGTLVVGSGVSMALILGNRERMKFLQAPLIRSVVTLLFYFTLPFFR
jgi:hypothetical protein